MKEERLNTLTIYNIETKLLKQLQCPSKDQKGNNVNMGFI